MPARDGRGPQGAGPMTGWGMGNCTVPLANGATTYQGGGFGQGRGLGRGLGRGFGRGLGLGRGQGGGYGAYQTPAPTTKEQDLQMLKAQAEILKQEMSAVQAGIERLQSENKK